VPNKSFYVFQVPKKCEKNELHRKVGKTAVKPVYGHFLPVRFHYDFQSANGQCAALLAQSKLNLSICSQAWPFEPEFIKSETGKLLPALNTWMETGTKLWVERS